MKTTLSLTLTLLTFVMLAFAPNSFAQQVRLIYFLPTDRESKTDIDAKFDTLIRDVQQFYADVMEHHGFGEKTFTYETDSEGNAVVHHVAGKSNEAAYENWPTKAWEEIDDLYGTSSDIYVVALDISKDFGGIGTGNNVHGKALVPAFAVTGTNGYIDTSLVIHELAHAFGLKHDGRDINEVNWAPVSQDSTDSIAASLCAAGWLDVHRFFNSSQTTENYNASVQMLTPALVEPPLGIRLRFTVTDPDGLHQAQLVKNSSGDYLLLGYKQLDSTTTTIEFTTDRLLGTNEIALRVIDQQGNFNRHTFPIDVIAILPPSGSVSISDTNLASAIRRALSLTSEATITELHMQGLTGLDASSRQVTDLTGLEHATNMQFLILRDNQISDITPLTGMTELLGLYLENNQISDITPLTELTNLGQLWIRNNQISDITPLVNLTNLFSLWLENNSISDITPLAGLTRLKELRLNRNQISDITPLAGLTEKLEELTLNNAVGRCAAVAAYRNG